MRTQNLYCSFLLLARGRDRLETYRLHDTKQILDTCLLLARGRDRLETSHLSPLCRQYLYLLLARGRDRLETPLA